MSKQVSDANSRAEAELSFEQALAELEKIVKKMESGELSLEQALATHKRGLELARFCQQRLEAAQQQVKVLEGEVLKPLADLGESE
jgi:exodeoxyribonuclease VII small subunit